MDAPQQAAASESGLDDSTGVEEEEELDSDSPQEAGSEEEDKKRRRKKKKKKKKVSLGAGEGGVATPPARSPRTKAENDSRFAAALEHLQKDDSDSTWTRLDQCNIFDGKIRRIAKALKKNRQVTSLDLSGNGIGDEGAQALSSVLGSGAAPELILLDLRNNHISGSGMEALWSLQNTRRQLKIELGEMPGEDREVSESVDEAAEVIVKEGVEQSSPKFQDAAAESLFMQKFFQGGNGSWEGVTETADEPPEPVEDPEVATARLWGQVHEEVDCSEPSIHILSSALRELAQGVGREMDAAEAPLPAKTRLDDLRHFSRSAVANLAKLHAVLDIMPSPKVSQHSKETPLAALGSHRAAVAQLVLRLMVGRTGAINIHIVKAALIPRLTVLCFEHPCNNVLHATCIEIVRFSLESGLRALWQPLFRPQMGLSGMSQPSGSVLQLLIQVADGASASCSISSRACSVGMALNLAKQFLDASQGNDTLARHLQEDKEWVEFAKAGGLLETLLAEQTGDLCGPRPDRNCAQAPSEEEWDQSNAGSILNGQDLLALLASTMNGLHVQNGGPEMG